MEVNMLIAFYILGGLGFATGSWYLWKASERIAPFLMAAALVCCLTATVIYVGFVMVAPPLWQKFMVLVAPLVFSLVMFVLLRHSNLKPKRLTANRERKLTT